MVSKLKVTCMINVDGSTLHGPRLNETMLNVTVYLTRLYSTWLCSNTASFRLLKVINTVIKAKLTILYSFSDEVLVTRPRSHCEPLWATSCTAFGRAYFREILFSAWKQVKRQSTFWLSNYITQHWPRERRGRLCGHGLCNQIPVSQAVGSLNLAVRKREVEFLGSL